MCVCRERNECFFFFLEKMNVDVEFPSHWWRGREGIYSCTSSPSSSSSSSLVQESWSVRLCTVCGLVLPSWRQTYLNKSFFKTLHYQQTGLALLEDGLTLTNLSSRLCIVGRLGLPSRRWTYLDNKKARRCKARQH